MSNTTAQPVLGISHGFSSGCSSSRLTGNPYSRSWQRTYRFTLTPGAIAYRDMRSLQWPVQACFAERRTKLAIDLCGHADCFVGLLLGHIVELWLSGDPGQLSKTTVLLKSLHEGAIEIQKGVAAQQVVKASVLTVLCPVQQARSYR